MNSIAADRADAVAAVFRSEIRGELSAGPRADLLPLLSWPRTRRPRLASYLDAVRVLAAVSEDEVSGDLGLVDGDRPGVGEIQNLAGKAVKVAVSDRVWLDYRLDDSPGRGA